MTDIAALSISIDSTSAVTAKERQDALTASGEKLEKQTTRLSDTDRLYQSIARRTRTTLEEVREKYESAVQTQKSLETAVTQQAKADEIAASALKDYGLSAEEATQALAVLEATGKSFNAELDVSVKALKAMGAVSDESGAALGRAGGHSMMFQRHLLMLGREIAHGDFARVPMTLAQLALHTGQAVTELVKMYGPAAAVGGALAWTIKSAYDVEKLNESLGRVSAQLAATGRAGLASTAELAAYVASLKSAGHVTEEAAAKTVEAFARQANVGRRMFSELIGMVPDFARAVGEEAPAAALKLARAFNEPLTGVIALDRELNFLTVAQYKQIIAMREHGDAAGIAKVGLAALHKQIDGLRNEGLTPLQKAWTDLLSAWRGTPDAGAKAGGMMDTLAKNVGLAADAVRTAREYWQRFVDMMVQFAKDNPMLASALGMNALVIAVQKGERGIVDGHVKFVAELKAQDDRAVAGQRDQIAQRQAAEKAALEKRLADEKRAQEERQRMVEKGLEGESAALLAQEEEYYQYHRNLLKLMRERNAEAEKLQKLDTAGWVKKIDEDTKAYEEGLAAQGRAHRSATQQWEIDFKEYVRLQTSAWADAGAAAGQFFTDVLVYGRDAFESLKALLKNFLAQLIAIFAQRWILQIGAALIGGSVGQALAGAAGQVGQGTFMGSVAGAIGSAFTGTSFGGGLATGWQTGAAGGLGGAAGVGQSVGAYASQAWAWAAANPVTVVAAVIAIAALAISHFRRGGDKFGGSFFGEFDSSGNFIANRPVPGTDNGRFFTPSDQDAAMRTTGMAFARNFFDTLRRLGGTTAGLSFGLGTDQDPRGSAANRVMGAIYRDGMEVFRSLIEAGRDDEDLQRAFGTMMSRMLVAGLQQSNLPAQITAILNTVDALTATEEQIAATIELAVAFGDLLAALKPLSSADLIKEAGRNSTEVLADFGAQLLQLAGRTDLTAESVATLTDATNQYRQAAAQLILGLESASRQITSMFNDLATGIRLSTMSPEQQYRFYQAEVQRLYGQIATATSAEQITAITTTINQYMAAAWGLLSPEQRAGAQSGFLAGIDRVTAAAQERLTFLMEQAVTSSNTVLSRVEALMTELVNKQAAAAEKNLTAAEKQNVAADKNLAAANTPSRVDLRLDLSSGAVVNSGG